MKTWALSILVLLMMGSSCSRAKQEDNSPSTESGIRVVKEFYPDGKLKSTTEAKGKLRHGESRDYRKDGTLENLITYQNNLKHGPAYTYYSDGETLKNELNYQEGRQHGVAKRYYPSGAVYKVTLYLNGNIEGLRSSYYEDGGIQSEITYQSGRPGMDLKEYSRSGKLKDFNSRIVFTEKDRINLDNNFTLYISLSDKRKNVKFYKGELTNGQFWNDKLSPIETENGIGRLEFHVSKGSFKMETINIVARIKAEHNNYYMLQRKYHLALENKF